MNPQNLIAAFLGIWETNPDNILQSSGATQGLDDLQKRLVACQGKSDLELANELGQWCSDYQPLSQKVMDKLGEKKLRGANNAGPKTDDRAVVNQYPEITEILRNRVPRMGKQEGKSQPS